MFAYLVVEGIRHTHDLKKYCLRLSVWAVAVYAGNALLNFLFRLGSGTLPEAERAQLYRNPNAIFTLALGTIGIAIVLWGKRQKTAAGKWAYVLSAVVFCCGFLYGEWGSVVLPFMYIEYFLRDKKTLRLSGYVLIELIAVLLSWGEPFWFFVFPFIFLYNGKRGPKTRFSKNFFYLFYLIHLWVIAIMNFLVVMGRI
ncbi:MAG: conjugal transfer protein TraX [Acetatifactor sp.]|nr:conjugal transfer protein TraX [Acetatifactor sp.]